MDGWMDGRTDGWMVERMKVSVDCEHLVYRRVL